MYPKTKKLQTLFAAEDIPLERTWEALLALQRRGLIRAIGGSNFTSDQVLALQSHFGRVDGPQTNQVESHPFCAQHRMAAKLNAAGIPITAYSPLGNYQASKPQPGATVRAKPPPPSPLNHTLIQTIAQKHEVAPAQVLLRWNLQLGRLVVPKSVQADRIRMNGEVFHFHLSSDDMAAIETLNHPPTQTRFLNPSSFKRTPRKWFFTEFE